MPLMTQAERCSHYRKTCLFTVLLHMFRINQFSTLNYTAFQQGFCMMQPTQWAEMVRLENYLCGMFPLIYYSPENGFSLVSYIFICIFSSTGFAERRYHQEVSFSLVSLSLLSQNSSWLLSSTLRKPVMFWGHTEYLLGEQDEET